MGTGHEFGPLPSSVRGPVLSWALAELANWRAGEDMLVPSLRREWTPERLYSRGGLGARDAGLQVTGGVRDRGWCGR